MRSLPNIVVTGTPCTGKSTTADHLVSLASDHPALKLQHLDVNTVAKSQDCYSSYDDRLSTHVVDDDKLLDALEAEISDGEGPGGWILDWHSCDLFPIRWVDLVVVLRCERTDVMYDRMKARGYGEEKLQENIDAEIFGVVAEEAKEAFEGDCDVVELKSEVVEDMEQNAARILEWVKAWVEQRRGVAEEIDGG